MKITWIWWIKLEIKNTEKKHSQTHKFNGHFEIRHWKCRLPFEKNKSVVVYIRLIDIACVEKNNLCALMLSNSHFCASIENRTRKKLPLCLGHCGASNVEVENLRTKKTNAIYLSTKKSTQILMFFFLRKRGTRKWCMCDLWYGSVDRNILFIASLVGKRLNLNLACTVRYFNVCVFLHFFVRRCCLFVVLFQIGITCFTDLLVVYFRII